MVPTAQGLDDVDLDGNWAVGHASDGEGEADHLLGRKKKRKKRKAVGHVPDKIEGEMQPTLSDGKKRKKRKVVGQALHTMEATNKSLGSEGTASKNGRSISIEALRTTACQRFKAAWAAHVKAEKLSTLEAQEVVPKDSWFSACWPDATLDSLPSKLVREDVSASRTLLAIHEGADAVNAIKLPAAEPGTVAVAVLCLSVERVFVVHEMLQSRWGVKAFALCAHGGGRKRDQIARQAKAVASGVAVGIGTPGRILRLMDEGHLKPSGLEAILLDLKPDRKQRDLLELPETRRDLFGLLRRHLLPVLSQTSQRLLLCCGP